MPSKLEEVKTEEAVQDECQSINEEELEKGRCSASSPAEQAETDGPVDFTIKTDPNCSSPEVAQDKELPDMAAFLASASAAVRNVTHFQVSQSSQGFVRAGTESLSAWINESFYEADTVVNAVKISRIHYS